MAQFFTAYPYIPAAEPDSILKVFRRYGRERVFKKGEVLKPAHESGLLFLVEEGVCAYVQLAETQSVIPFLLLPGRTLGDISLLAGSHYKMEWRALSDGRLLVVPPTVLTHVVLSDHQLTLEKIKHIISKEEAALEAKDANMTLPSEMRLRLLIMGLLLATDTYHGEWMVLPHRLNAETLGMVVSLNRTNVTRQISEWRQKGLAQREGADLLVHKSLFQGLEDWRKNPDDSDV